jgi:hypothetical protein
VCDHLSENGHDSDAETIEQESGENGYEMWTMRNLYEFLQHIVGGQKQTSELLDNLGVPGIWATGVHAGLDDTIYVTFNDNIKILGVEKIA